MPHNGRGHKLQARPKKLSREDTAPEPNSTSRLLRHRKVSQEAGGGTSFPTRQKTVCFRALLYGGPSFGWGCSQLPNRNKGTPRLPHRSL